jgi:hypothetical protein
LIYDLSQRILRLGGQYRSLVLTLQNDSTLEFVFNDQGRQTYAFQGAFGMFTLILGRIGAIYRQSDPLIDELALYGFEGRIEVEDNLECNRELDIGMRNGGKQGLYLSITTVTT